MVSIDYLAYGFKRLFRKPILEIIHFGFYNSRLIPIHMSNKLMLKRKGDLSISDYEFAINILGLNLSDNSDIYESVYQYTLTKDKTSFFFDPDSTLLKEDYLSNYSLDLCYYADAVFSGSGTLAREAPCMGTTSFSFFPISKLLSVDQYFVDKGRVLHFRDIDEIIDYTLKGTKERSNLDFSNSKKVKTQVISNVKQILENS